MTDGIPSKKTIDTESVPKSWCRHVSLYVLAPNAYSLDPMVGKTVRAGKNQSPIFTMRPKHKVGAFYEDLAKVRQIGLW